MIIKTNIVHWFKACAITAYPFIFASNLLKGPVLKQILIHEMVHWTQQRRWFFWGLGVGLLVWYLLYLLVLPVGWNPFRRKWETEAMRAAGVMGQEISWKLKRAPYYLWWS